MGWGIIPNLSLEKVSATQSAFPRCCHAQTLLRPTLMVCFCIQNFTLPTSFYRAGASTPWRQPLFEFENFLDGLKCKSEPAAANEEDVVRHFLFFLDYYVTAQITVTYRTKHETLSIPLPRHPTIPLTAAFLGSQNRCPEAGTPLWRTQRRVPAHGLERKLMGAYSLRSCEGQSKFSSLVHCTQP